MKRHCKNKIYSLILVASTVLLTMQPFGVYANNTSDNIPSSADHVEQIQAEIDTNAQSFLLSETERPEYISRNEVEKNGFVRRLSEYDESLNSITLQDQDGTNTTYIFSENVKYIDSAGVIKDKKSTLTENITELAYQDQYAYTNTNNDVRMYFPNSIGENTGVVLEKEDIRIELTPVQAKKIATTAKSISLNQINAQAATPIRKQINQLQDGQTVTKDAIDYDAVFGTNTTLRYTPTLNGFKEDIILDTYDGTNEFVFRLKTNGLRLVCQDEQYFLVHPTSGKIAVQMGELLVYSEGSTEMNTEYQHRYEASTVTENEEYLLTVIVDESFLLSESTQYPVVIDPSFEICSNDNHIMDISVRINGTVIPNSTNDGTGNHYTEKNDMRTFIKFPGLYNNSLIYSLHPPGYGTGDDQEVESIKLQMYSRGTSIVDGDVKVYAYNTASSLDWDYNTTNFTQAQYNALGSLWSTTEVPRNVPQWVEFNITKAAYPSVDKGIVLVNEYVGAGNDPAYQSFASTKDPINKPRIVVTWSGATNDSFNTAVKMTLASSHNVNIPDGTTKRYFYFIPEVTGFYTFRTTDRQSGDPQIWLYNSSQELLEDEDVLPSYLAGFIYHLSAGQKYYIAAGCKNEESGSFSCSILYNTIGSVYPSTELTLSEVQESNIDSSYQRQLFSFTPSITTLHMIRSLSNVSSDPYVWIYDSNGNLIAENDNISTTDNNFSVNCQLTKNQKYFIVAGCNGTGTGTYDIRVSFVIPEKPTNLTADNVSESSVHLSWDTLEPHNAERFLVQYRLSGSNTWINDGYTWMKEYTVDDLDTTQSYDFRVYSEAGETAWEGVWSEPSDIVLVPAMPINLTIDQINGNTVGLSWIVPANHGADRFLIQYRVSAGTWYNAAYTTATEYDIFRSSTVLEYEYRVYAETGAQAWQGTRSAPSNVVIIPARPTGLTVSDVRDTSVHLSWNTTEPHGADRFLIQYRQSGNSAWINAGYTWEKQYTVTGLYTIRTYEFRVYSEAGFPAWGATWSGSSNIATATTLPAQPTNLTTSNITADTVKLTWNTVEPHGADFFLIQYRPVGASTWTNAGSTREKQYTVSGLIPSSVYEFRVYSEDGEVAWGGIWSLPSNIATAQTLPEQPEILTASNVTTDSVYLSWTTKNPHGADRWLVKCRPVGGVWYIAATVTFQECIVSNLQPNTTYEFYVYSEAGPVAWVGLLSFPSETITITTLPITADLSSSALQAAFYNATRNDEKDYDGVFGLQCVDLYRWFVDTYTSLHGTSGNGKDCAANLAATVPGGKTINTPTPYSVFSTNTYGVFGCYDTVYGHTGIVLSVDTVNKTCVIFHTGNSAENENPNSWISTVSYENVTSVSFFDLKPFM